MVIFGITTKHVKSESAFTLIEILAITAIIGILTSLILPVFASARKIAYRSNCTSNMRQIGYAFQMYYNNNNCTLPHEDNGDTRPPFGCGWYIVLKKYVDKDTVFICPAASDKPDYFSYKMNSLLETEEYPFFVITRGNAASNTVLLLDGRIDNKGVRRQPKGTCNMVSDRHGEGANFLFLDMHCELVQNTFDNAGWEDEGGLVWDPYK